MEHFFIEGPAAISFSGGRTSAYMLRRILDAHGGRLPPAVVPIFANTGRERAETLDFIQECSERWGVRVRWVEWQPEAPRWREVDYATASRDGEPFAQLIAWKRYLPNPIQRICTQHLKIETMKRFIVEQLGFEEWTMVVGIRHDEPRRWRILGEDSRNAREFKVGPLVEAKVDLPEVMRFWAESPFDLQLQPDEGNCDLCFLKGKRKLVPLIAKRPHSADWWIAQEALSLGKTPGGGRFRVDRPPYSALREEALRSLPVVQDDGDEDSTLPCACHD